MIRWKSEPVNHLITLGVKEKKWENCIFLFHQRICWEDGEYSYQMVFVSDRLSKRYGDADLACPVMNKEGN